MAEKLRIATLEVIHRYINFPLMRFIVSVFILLSSFTAVAQFNDSVRTGVVVQKDPRLDILSAKQAEINKRSKILAGNGFKRGWRIQVANTQNRDEANNVKAEMLRRFPDQKAYMLYQAPNFRVRVGNFSTQREAETLKKMISLLYPNRGIYIVSDLIEYKILAEDEDM